MNEVVKAGADAAIKQMKKLERNTKNMVAAQNSKYYTSKYQASKYSMNMSKMSKYSVSKINAAAQG